MDERMPNCRQCEHFHVTWDNAAPVGCKKFGFKCRQMPSLEVLATTGKQCIFFEAKAAPGGQPMFRPPQLLPDHCSFSIMG